MATTLKTPTRIVTVTLIDRTTGIDWSGDYLGNHCDANLRRDYDMTYSYLTDDETADWWAKQCAAQQEADDALAELSSDQRETVLSDSRLHCDLVDQPSAILAAIADVLAEGEN